MDLTETFVSTGGTSSDALVDVVQERMNQREQFVTSMDDELTPAEWIARLAKHLGRAVATERVDYRRQLVIVGALALAAVEAYDRKYNMEIE